MPPQIENQIEPEIKESKSNFTIRKEFIIGILLGLFIFAVIIGGIFIYIDKSIEGSDAPYYQKTELNTEDQFINWKTYRNEEYGFEFKLPLGWSALPVEVKKEGDLLSLLISDGNTYDNLHFSFVVSSIDPKISIDKWFYDNANYTKSLDNLIKIANNTYSDGFLKRSDFIVSTSSVLIENRIAIFREVRCLKSDCYFLGSPQNSLEYFFRKDNLLFKLKVESISFGDDFSILREIFSSFKFISTSTSTLINESKNQLDITFDKLFDGAYWEESYINSSLRGDYYVSYYNYNYEPNPQKKQQQFFQPAGRLWETTILGLSNIELENKRIEFERYYDNQAKSLGWSFYKNIDEKKMSVSGPMADGATGSIWGYVNVQNNNLKMIGLGYQIENFTDTSVDGPVEITCPCDLKLKVFISDIIDINKLTF